jgi:hypothetical protein
MAFPTKEYNKLEGLQKIWGVSQEDMFYTIENGLLRVCVWLPLRFIERGVMKNKKFIYENHEPTEGFVALRPEDCRRICSTGRAKLNIFKSISEEAHSLRLAYEPPQPAINVRISDLVVLKKDRKKFEATYDIAESNILDLHPKKTEPSFIVSKDYRYMKLNGKEYHFGDVQARVIEQLHDAAQSHKPWVHSKTLLYESGSNAVRLRDLFKSNKDWNDVIASNKRGYYRLNVPLEGISTDSEQDIQPDLKQQSC